MKQKYLFIRLIILGLFFVATNSFAQKTVIHILDEHTSEPCPFANVVLYDKNNYYLKGTVSNDNGDVTFEIKEKSKIVISYVGYKTLTDYITPGENKTIHLQPSYFEMESVVVTGQYKPQPVDKSIYKIDVIGLKQMEERGVNNLAEALANETNIRLQHDPALGTSLTLQGLSGENVKFLIDGVPMIGRLNGNIDLSQINMDNVDHIEIVQGPMAVVYGTNALAGVVNIITKENTRNKNLLNISSYTGTEGAYNLSMSGSVIRKKHTFALSGARNMFQGIDMSDTSRSMEFKPKLQYNAGFDYSYRKGDLKVRFKSSYFDEEIRHYGNLVPADAVTANDVHFYTNRYTNSLQINNKLTESLYVDFLGAYSYFDRQTQNYRKDLTTFEQKAVGDVSQTSFTNMMMRGNFSIVKLDSKLNYQFGFDINLDDAKGDKISTDDPSMGDYAAYLSAQYQFLKNASVQPGLRFIYNTKYGAPLIPSVNLQWELFKGFNFRASYARGFRSPSIKELYLDFVDSNHDLHGNDSLEAETNNSYNTSITYSIERSKYMIKFEPRFFFNDGKNMITLVQIEEGFNAYQNTNLGIRRTIGGDFNVKFLFYPSLTINAGFNRTGSSYSRSTDVADLPDYTFYNNYTFNAKYNFRKQKLTLAVFMKYYGSTPHIVLKDDELVTITKDVYGDVEASVTKLLWKDKISLVIGGKNLLNNDYIGYSDGSFSNQPTAFGRYYFIKLNIKLDML